MRDVLEITCTDYIADLPAIWEAGVWVSEARPSLLYRFAGACAWHRNFVVSLFDKGLWLA